MKSIRNHDLEMLLRARERAWREREPRIPEPPPGISPAGKFWIFYALAVIVLGWALW